MSDVLISGYYGFGNSGDDTLLLSIIRQLKEQKSDIEIAVLSKNPQETEKVYGVLGVRRDNIFSLLKSVINTKMLILGGGTLIQDKTSTKSLWYYLFIIWLAKFMSKKVMLYANGIGPIQDKNIKLTKKILNKADVITLRDEMSKGELLKIGVDKPEITITADSAFCIYPNHKTEISEYKRKWLINDDADYFLISLRDHKRLSKDFCKILAQAFDYISSKYNCYPVFIPFQKQRDMKNTEEVRALMQKPSSVLEEENIDVVLDVICDSRLCVGMRLHSLIYSAICEVPLIGLVYDPKITGFMEYIGQNNFLDAEKLSYEELIALIDNCFLNSASIKNDLLLNHRILSEKANKNAKIAMELFYR